MKNLEAKQLSLFEWLRKRPIGEVVPIPATAENVGGELLNILSKGLYTNPLDALREYVQNAIDADAAEVYIQVTGNSVTIFDWGHGMSLEELLQAREFGVSKKSMEENVGFRGIGIYSGFDLCERLVLRTKPVGDDNEYMLEFEFGRMRQILDEARKDPARPVIPLLKLLSENTFFIRESASDSKVSFTQVELQEISDQHIYRLSNVEDVKKYILRNLPIRFDQEFEYAEAIEEALAEHVDGYKSATVILKIDDAEEVLVQKPRIPNLDKPKMGIITSGDKKLGFWWACLVSGSDSLASKEFEKSKYKEYAGFVYKVKGFTIGDRNRFRKYVSRIYDWWTGEIYVTDIDVIPTSARDDFEAGLARDTLENAISRLLSGSDNKDNLQKYAVNKQETRRADSKIGSILAEVDKVADNVQSGDFDQFVVYSHLESLIKQVKQQRSKATNKEQADELIERISKLQEVVRKEIENPTPVSERKKDATRSAIEKAETRPEQEERETEKEDESSSLPPTEQTTSLSIGSEGTDQNQDDTIENISLLQIIDNMGWGINDEMLPLLMIISNSIDDVLGSTSEQYSLLMREIEERFIELIEEEEE